MIQMHLDTQSVGSIFHYYLTCSDLVHGHLHRINYSRVFKSEVGHNVPVCASSDIP